jgi:hypothetical protein
MAPGRNLAYNVTPTAGCQSRREGVEQDECRSYCSVETTPGAGAA